MSMSPSSPPAPAPSGPEGWHWNAGRIAGLTITVALAGFWIWAFSPLPDRGNPDRMTDRAFPAAAEAVCAEARSAIDALPAANTADDFAARADLVDRGTVVIRGMIADLGTLPVDNAEERGWVDAWLDDYATYTDDRDSFAALLRAGDDRAPTFSVRGLEGVPTLVTGFAKVNNMSSCEVPGDV
jgi:hypothetical protein